MRLRLRALALGLLAAAVLLPSARGASPSGPRVLVSFPADLERGTVDGRLLLLVSKEEKGEPRFQVSDTSLTTAQVFGVDIEGMGAGQEVSFDAPVRGYPKDSLRDLPAAEYTVQALLHRYETFRRADGHVVKLPMDRGEGQQWNRAPGNLYSKPRRVALDPKAEAPLRIALDSVIPPIPDPPETKYVKHVKIRSERLSKFWGRDMYLGAHVLLPLGFDEHPQARYPLMIAHGHFPYDFSGFRPEPPEKDLPCERSERFQLDCYNRIQQELAHQLYEDWTSADFPRVLAIEIQHANPYYDDSYAVNSANLGPYGDAIVYELIPEIEKRFRGIGQGWARFMYGGSTGGWEALAAQVFYPDEFNGCYAACPDPIDFRANMTMNVYEDANAYWAEGPFRRVPRPAHRNWLGHVSATIEQMSRLESVLASRGRSGQQLDVWQAVYSPLGPDGYPQPIWDRTTGVIDPKVAAHWRENYDLVHIMKRDWEKGLGRKLEGKVNLYVGDMDNYYLNNAVYFAEEFLRSTRNPYFAGEIAYGDRAEHCWNGDKTRPNAHSRLRYHQMFVPKAVERMLKSAPAGADLTSWRY
ncbi:MAG: hypothetical protein AB7O37_07370 [Vicinamibacteria bacterium]